MDSSFAIGYIYSYLCMIYLRTYGTHRTHVCIITLCTKGVERRETRFEKKSFESFRQSQYDGVEQGEAIQG